MKDDYQNGGGVNVVITRWLLLVCLASADTRNRHLRRIFRDVQKHNLQPFIYSRSIKHVHQDHHRY